MKITAQNLGKKFRNEWVFKRLSYEFQSGKSYTFVGANGSGKSTLLQVLSGFMPHSEGVICYEDHQKSITVDNYYQYLSIAAPYLELIEDFTLTETIEFHTKFKPFKNNFSKDEFIDFIELPKAKNKEIKFFSSGMKQRVKLGLAFWSDCEILMLDEPTSNLDIEASGWYLRNVQEYSKNRILFICSNQASEYQFCPNILNIQDYK
jgi:ATPase subunit of ABC transporter with duplicated ATPase domains